MKKNEKRRPDLKNKFLYGAFVLLQLFVRILPERLGDWLGRQLGLLSYYTLPDRRRVAMDNLRLALGLADGKAGILARQSFAALGLLGVELLRFAGQPALIRKRVRIRDEEILQRALALGRGVLLLPSHLGNWELLGQFLGVAGYRVHPIVQVQANKRFYEVVDRIRRQAGLLPITRGRLSLREIIHALRQGDCVSIIPDQDAGRNGIFVPFFGRLASTPRGLDTVARLTGAPVIPVFIRRIKPGYHEVRFHPPLDLVRTDDPEADELENLKKINLLLEEEIRRSPEQWLWMHKRWKTRPPRVK